MKQAGDLHEISSTIVGLESKSEKSMGLSILIFTYIFLFDYSKQCFTSIL
jgi:hypothetical protein